MGAIRRSCLTANPKRNNDSEKSSKLFQKHLLLQATGFVARIVARRVALSPSIPTVIRKSSSTGKLKLSNGLEPNLRSLRRPRMLKLAVVVKEKNEAGAKPRIRAATTKRTRKRKRKKK